MLPQPRKPRCLAHHIWMAGCTDCAEQHRAEQAAARRRLEQAAR